MDIQTLAASLKRTIAQLHARSQDSARRHQALAEHFKARGDKGAAQIHEEAAIGEREFAENMHGQLEGELSDVETYEDSTDELKRAFTAIE